MGRLSRLGLGMFTLGTVVVVLDYAARAAFPEQWGGPNIGGGLILFAGAGLAIIGAIVVLVKFVKVGWKK